MVSQRNAMLTKLQGYWGPRMRWNPAWRSCHLREMAERGGEGVDRKAHPVVSECVLLSSLMMSECGVSALGQLGCQEGLEGQGQAGQVARFLGHPLS